MGAIHGLLFVLYALFWLDAWNKAKWPLKTAALYFVLSVLPFGGFVADREAQARGRRHGRRVARRPQGRGGRRVIVAFSVTPLGVGEDVGAYVADAVQVVRESGLPNRTDAMFTTLEGEWDEVMDVVKRAVARSRPARPASRSS